MVCLCWRGCLTTFLFITSSIQAIPIASSSTQIELAATSDDMNIHRLAQHVSSHLLFEHVDPLVYNLSQHIASVLRTSMTLQRRPFPNDPPNRIMIQLAEEHLDHDTIPVDTDLLLGQLQGAVGSFLEDKLPGIWNRQLAGLDRNMMQSKLEHHLLSHCTTECIPDDDLLQVGDLVIQDTLTQAWLSILQDELPYLFNAAKIQVNGVLSLFDPPEHQDYQLQWNMDWREMETKFMEHWTILIANLPCHSSDHSAKLQWTLYSK